MRLTFIIWVLITGLTLLGCDTTNSAKKELEQMTKDFGALVDQAKQQIYPHTNKVESYTKAELEKLFQLEYIVREIPAGSSTAELNTFMSQLGAERWDCFYVDSSGEQIRVFCKRRPKSYLQYIPKAF